jgi:type IV secretory pathway VirB10-like protein
MNINTPYDDPDEAKLVTPDAPRKNKNIFVVVAVLFGIILALAVVSNIANLVVAKPTVQVQPKPITMTKDQGDSFGRQQKDQADFMVSVDRNKKNKTAADIVMGYGKDLAGNYHEAEADGVPARTSAQEAAINGSAPPQKSAAELRREKAEGDSMKRREYDLNSTTAAVDFSDVFAKEQEPSLMAKVVGATGAQASATREPYAAADAPSQATLPPPPVPPEIARRRAAVTAALAAPESAAAPEEVEARAIARKDKAHDPSEDYVFDASSGKLYRLMEHTIIECVLVNRVAGAANGPVIVMVTTDVFSLSGTHLLIQKGTRLHGDVIAISSVSQERLFVAFHRMIMPDGYSVSLDKFKGLDVVGETGLRDLVNHHYAQIFGASLALAAVAATTQVGNTTNALAYGWGSNMRTDASQQLGQSAQRVMERFLNVLPTFTIRERELVKVMLANDILLPDVKTHAVDKDL